MPADLGLSEQIDRIYEVIRMNTNNEPLRLFICTAPPEDTAAELYAFISELRQTADYKWVSREQLHITLKFLGDSERSVAESLSEALKGIKAAQFDIELERAGAFPGMSNVRALWLGAGTGASELASLARQTDKVCCDMGFPGEKRPFKAHMTLARSRSDGQIPAPLAERLNRPIRFAWRCRSFILMRSELTRSGPIYTPIGEYGLSA